MSHASYRCSTLLSENIHLSRPSCERSEKWLKETTDEQCHRDHEHPKEGAQSDRQTAALRRHAVLARLLGGRPGTPSSGAVRASCSINLVAGPPGCASPVSHLETVAWSTPNCWASSS